MDELDLIYSKNIPTDILGDLEIKTSIAIWDYPVAFICQSRENKYYAFLENDDSLDHFGWNVTEVTLDEIKAVNDGKKNIQSLFIDHKCFLAFGTDKSEIINIKEVDAFTGIYEIKGNLFVKDFCDMD